MIIKCSVLDKIARISSGIVGICGNSDYVIRFTFDEEWDAYETKTARFKWNGTYTDVVFTGNECPMPIVQNTYNVEIGVYAGNLHTTTSAYLPMKKSILCGSGFPADPSDDVYNQIMTLLNSKANSNQGAENAGKYWKVGKDGNLEFGECSGGTTTTEVQITAAVSEGTPLTIDAQATEQTVNLAWNIPSAKVIPAFTNYYLAKSNISYPRTFDTSGYTQTWNASNYHGNADAYVSGHLYFCAMEYEMDGDSTAELVSWGTTVTPSGTATLSGSGWVYGIQTLANANSISFALGKTSSGTGTIKHLYCIDVTALQEAGTISSTTINDLVSLFGGLDLVPGQNFAGESTSGSATLTITRNGAEQTIDSPTSTATIKGGDVLTISDGSVTFIYTTTQTVVIDTRKWTNKKWCAFGDSLTDPSINATQKYHAIIAEKTGISVTVLGTGGTGYYKTKDNGTAYYQRMENCPADADVVTIFGSVNDWNAVKNGGLTIGNASDALSAETYSGYVNECIDVAISKAPYAQIALVTPMDYHGLPDETLEAIASALIAVAKYRKIKCLDLYHTSGFRVDDATFAQTYTTDYSTTADTYGHPSNAAHEKLIAPAFLELLKSMILYA